MIDTFLLISIFGIEIVRIAPKIKFILNENNIYLPNIENCPNACFSQPVLYFREFKQSYWLNKINTMRRYSSE